MPRQDPGEEPDNDSRKLLKGIMYYLVVSQQDRGEELDEDLKELLKGIMHYCLNKIEAGS